MHLDPGSVELDLDRGGHAVAEDRERCGDIGRRRRQHRHDGHPDGQPHGLDVGERAGQGEVCRAPERPGQHHRAPDRLGRHTGGDRERIGDDSRQRPDADLAEEHPGEVILLVGGRLGPERDDLALAGGGRARATRVGEAGDGRVDGSNGQRRLGCGRHREVTDRAEADPELALPRRRHEEADRGLDLGRLDPTQELGEERDLGRPG